MNPAPVSRGAQLAPLVCVARIEETPNAATFVFARPDARPMDYKAGQFIVVAVDVGDESLHRAYSLSSSPARGEQVAITVKRVADGRVSNHLVDHLRPGHVLHTLPPAGEFNIVDRPSTRHVVLLSAGCGITPCISIARWLLDTAQDVDIDFIHSAHSGSEVIMRDELDRLHAQHANFRLARVLRHPERANDFHGPLDRGLFDRLLPDLEGRSVFCCGPQGYMDSMRGIAEARGFNMDYFHCETFSPPAAQGPAGAHAGDDSACGTAHALEVPGFDTSARIAPGQTLLEALEGAGVPIVGACRSGVCGSCKCRVVAGEVESTSTATLHPDEIAEGYVLACSSTARSDLTVAL